MINCKNCNKTRIVKNGIARGKQRYKCKDCGCNFTQGDDRIKKENEAKKSLAVLLYSLGRGSFRFIGRILDVSNVSVYKWINKIADKLEEPKVVDNIKEIEFGEMWHFINSKKTRNGSLKPWIVVQGEPSLGLQVVVMLKHSKSYIRKSVI
jgi:transposase